MINKQLSLITSIFVIGISFFSFILKPETNSATEASAKGMIEWIDITDLEDKLEAEPRKVIIDLYTDWCGWCKKMDRTTYKHKDIAKYVNEKYYAIKFNAESKKPIKVAGQEFKFIPRGRRGAHELAITLLEGRMSYPSTVILDNDLSKLTIIPGYVDAPKMDKILRYFGDGHQDKGVNWQVFDKQFKSKIK